MAAGEVKTSPLLDYCADAVAALSAQYDMTKVLGYNATMGAARESLIQNFLVDHLPEMTSVVSGVIVDAKGNRSKQQDIVLMLKSMPRLRFASGDDLIFQEGAVATFEIKTSIDTSGVINKIGENIQSVRTLSSTSLEGVRIGDLSWHHDRILTAVLTYNGTELSTIEEWLHSVPITDRPDLYLDLSKGILLKNDGSFAPVEQNDSEYVIIDSASIGLARFLTILARITAVVQLREVKWEEYIG
ncbi:DUF6602 domain-containing protein [Paenirhodobacter populi]|uniref:DUF6602 domain-containing protein n=1 Tax=Paenirhodobacter populi TaxID=2306993 RepID=A0A443JV10_9RHOB|nr:DUF6602 domain-containing protein [Sinirhodobacter populi]RWR24344.1 hypothetical protein D2T30_00010 [Sinirhodobacter populi]